MWTVPHKNGLEPLKKIEPLNGVIFTLPTNKMLKFSRIDKPYMEKMFVELPSLAEWYKHFGRPFVDNCTGNWHLKNFPSQYVYTVVYRTPLPWITQQKSK
jgi:hypothetical protein